jgi:CDP-glycerol glycerophosphotransferase
MSTRNKFLETYAPKRLLGALLRRRRDIPRLLLFRLNLQKQLKNAVLFEAFAGKVIGDSPLAIYLELRSQRPDLEFIWTVDNDSEAPAGSRPVKYGSFAWLYALATSKYLVINNYLPWYFRKAKGQVYLQTWHGTPLKRLGRDIENRKLSNSNLATIDREAESWDFLISPSPYCSAIFPGAFSYQGKILETGYPRNDRLSKTNSREIQLIREKIGISDPKVKVVMYAPTWREYARNAVGLWQATNFLDENLELPKGFQLIYRAHSNTMATHHKGALSQAIDVTSYPDITELYLAADIVITDYSSIMFDFSVTGKPMIFLAPDIEKYRSEQGFYFDFEQFAPGPVLKTNQEVLLALSEIGKIEKRYEKKYREWQEKFNSLEDGYAAKRVVSTVWGTK